ncbi:MAG: acyl-ACP--UDP-N-acetylglucosamine O-acyltransferase [Planctomycetes bacterium]|nr:acyl-ACP--UDP-N-acetylglucosamine O-acyltransferase [Planctomycetota bacterium]
MPIRISPLASVDARAELGSDVEIGPFCLVGPHVTLGDGCRLESHVTIVGHTRIGRRNQFFPGAVIGSPPQDKCYTPESETFTVIGDENQFREGVTVNTGAEKEDYTTRIGHRNLLMINSHVAHNCHLYDDVILVNGVLLGGHVHVQDGAIISGNTVVHHFTTVGTLAFVSGGCRVTRDVPPYFLAAGSDNPELKTINMVGLQRRGVPRETIALLKQAFRRLCREHKKVEAVRALFAEELGGEFPPELETLLSFVESQKEGRVGRTREAIRNAPPRPPQQKQRQERRAA